MKRTSLKTLAIICFAALHWGFSADHNDPNAVNSIFSDIAVDGADLYGLFGYPSDDKTGEEKVVIQLTFASAPATGVFDQDLVYTLNIDPDLRSSVDLTDKSFSGFIAYIKGLKDRYLKMKASQIIVSFDDQNQAKLKFTGFPGGDFFKVVKINQSLTIETPSGQSIKTFVGGRDDPFFNDLPGFFRSFNYGPQYYNIPFTMAKKYREMPIPKTFLELEGNDLFNHDPAHPEHGKNAPVGVKYEIGDKPITWSGNKFKKDADGDYRFVYSGKDAQVGRNVNAIAFEFPLSFLTTQPKEERIIRTWGESWVLTASGRIKHSLSTAERLSFWGRLKAWFFKLLAKMGMDMTSPEENFKDNLDDYQLVDHVGVPFADAALNQREDSHVGLNNLKYGREYIMRFAHLGWGFGPSLTAMGFGTCFDHSNSPVSVHKVYKLATLAFPRVKNCLLQKVNMPNEDWKKNGVDVPLKRVFEITVPNATAIDMDTDGTWPYGRRLTDQVASRFLSVFLDQKKGCGGKPCHVDVLNDPATFANAPIKPKTVPNPLKNDKEFLTEFPYLAEPW